MPLAPGRTDQPKVNVADQEPGMPSGDTMPSLSTAAAAGGIQKIDGAGPGLPGPVIQRAP